MMDPKDIIDLFDLKNASVRRNEITCSCPFTENHSRGDQRPSFGVNWEKGVAHCLGCGWSGNLVQMAQQLLGMSYMEAFKAVNPDLDAESAVRLMAGRQYEPVRAVNPILADVDRWAQNKSPYWHERGLTDASVGKWHLGYDPAENRVVVPVYWKGDLVGWSKRATDNVTQPKWKHSANMPRNVILFGMDNCVGDSCVLVEAPLSAIVLDQRGFGNPVASFGCSLSEQQALLIRSHFNKVLIFYDPDEAGRRGTRNAIRLLAPFVDTYVIGETRDDPAAITAEETADAMERIMPAWLWTMQNG